MGHEFAGYVVQTGTRVTNWKEGDRVVSETAAVIDANNPMSRVGLYNLDPSRNGFGYGVDGAMTRYVRVPARCLHLLPDHLDFATACLTEPCCVAFNAVAGNSYLKPGDRIIVVGPGTIGILYVAIARLSGAEVAITGLESDSKRLAIAKKYGCFPITGDAEDWAFHRDGLGADCIVDAAGATVSLKNALRWIRPGGHITKVGRGPQPVGFSLDPVVQKNVTLQGSFSHNWQIWERVIVLLSDGVLDVKPIIGGIWPISEWQQAFEKMYYGEVVKSILKPV